MKLIFVYNAVSGPLQALWDTAHKAISPNTYSCSLCALTYGVASEEKEWKRFREASGIEMIFLHKDQFLKQYRSKWLPKYDFPIILSENNNEMDVFMSAAQLNEFANLSAFMEAIEEKIKFFEAAP